MRNARRFGAAFLIAIGLLVAIGIVARVRRSLGPPGGPAARVPWGVATLLGQGEDTLTVSAAATDAAPAPLGTRGTVSLPPGAYRLGLNASVWRLEIESGRTSSVPIGAVAVEGTGADRYDVLDRSGGAEASRPTGKAMELFPGKYGICLNGVWRDVVVEAGARETIRTGVLLVRAETGMVYRVLDPADGRPLAMREVGRPVEMFAGTYRIACGGWSAVATVRPGTKWVVQPAAPGPAAGTNTVSGAAPSALNLH